MDIQGIEQVLLDLSCHQQTICLFFNQKVAGSRQSIGPQLSPADNLYIFLALSQQEADSLFIFLAFS